MTDELSQARTTKKEFLAQMNRMIPWDEWIGIITLHYYKGERGNKPYDLETMLRIHLLQNLYNLSDMGVMTEVIDSRAFSEFCGVDSSSGYLGAEKREDAIMHNDKGKKISCKINRRPSQSKHNSVRSKGQIKRREREKSSVRAKVEHVFGVVKGLFGYRKTRYKGRQKQIAKLHMMFALANLYLADKRCLTV